jgi:autotransporter-associated beta strand protein
VISTALLVGQPGYAANTTWSNVGLDFNTAGSWSAGVPGSGDTAVFNVARITNPNLSASLTIQGLNFSTASASGYDLTSSNTSIKLTLTNTGTGSSGAINSAITSGTNTIDAPIVLGAAAGTQNFTQAGGGTLIVNGVISSTNTIALGLRGSGTIQLNGANTFSSGASIDTANATVVLGHNSALGSGTLSINANSTMMAAGLNRIISNALTLSANATIAGTNELTLAGPVTLAGAASRTITANNTAGTTFSGNIFLSDVAGTGRTLLLNGSGAITLSGSIADFNGLGTAGNLTYNSTTGGTLTLSGSNTYSGTTTLSSGSVILGNKAAFGTSAVSYDGVTVSASTDLTGANAIANAGSFGATGNIFTGTNGLEFSGTLTNNVTSNTITNNIAGGVLRFSGQVNLSNSGTNRTLILSGSGNTVISGAIVNGSTSSSKLTYSGTGSLTLSHDNTYSGGTSVTSGTLLVKNTTGSATGTGAVSVTGTGTFGGNGTITGSLSLANGTNLSPGSFATSGYTAILRTGSLSLSAGSNFTLDLLNTTAGAGYDQLNVTGTVAIAGSNIIVRAGAGLTLGDRFFVLLNDGTDLLTGTFAQGAVVTSGYYTFSINYLANGDGGTTANDISLTVTGVPEPGTWVAGLFVLAIIMHRFLEKKFPRGFSFSARPIDKVREAKPTLEKSS